MTLKDRSQTSNYKLSFQDTLKIMFIFTFPYFYYTVHQTLPEEVLKHIIKLLILRGFYFLTISTLCEELCIYIIRNSNDTKKIKKKKEMQGLF